MRYGKNVYNNCVVGMKGTAPKCRRTLPLLKFSERVKTRRYVKVMGSEGGMHSPDSRDSGQKGTRMAWGALPFTVTSHHPLRQRKESRRIWGRG